MGLVLTLVCGLFLGAYAQWVLDRARMRRLGRQLNEAEQAIRYGCRWNVGPSVRAGVLSMSRVGRTLRVWQ